MDIIMIYAQGITRADDKLRNYITEHSSLVELVDIYHYSNSLPLRCELENMILIYYSMYWESFPSLVTRPLEMSMDFPIDIGLGYKAETNEAVKLFIELAQRLF